MKNLTSQCRSVVLASGSLAPINSLCAELGLFPPPKTSPVAGVHIDHTARLQTSPKPLEANHVIDLPKQLLALSIGKFPDNSSIRVNHANRNDTKFIKQLGDSVARIVAAIPYGGVLVFLPSFEVLKKYVRIWQDPTLWEGSISVWRRLHELKGKVVVEPSSSTKEEFEYARDEYNDTIKQTRNCVLFAVFRGKMSEGE